MVQQRITRGRFAQKASDFAASTLPPDLRRGSASPGRAGKEMGLRPWSGRSPEKTEVLSARQSRRRTSGGEAAENVTKGAITVTNCALLLLGMLFCGGELRAQAPAQQQAQAQPAIEEWRDDFDGDKLDDTKWEPFTFEGGSGGKIEVKEKQLRMRGAGESRSGIRSKQSFHGERFFVEAALAKVGQRAPRPGEGSFPAGYAIVTVLFDGNPANRLEWLLRSDGILEAWQSIDGRITRLDKSNLATKEKTPQLGIARRGEKIYFMLNREVGLETTLRGLSQNFRVMLYGFGSSENNWESIAVQTLKQ